jgi:iron(III) transport system ATP-binding protein
MTMTETQMTEAPALFVDGLTRHYSAGHAAGGGGISNVGFALRSGAFLTLLGPSGCGKTTILRCIAGLEEPDAGVISVGGETFFDADAGIEMPMRRRGIGMVFQSYAIWPHMTVFENVAFPLRVQGRTHSKAEITRRVAEALDVVSLGGFGDRPATQLSGGQQQRVAFARAIVSRPKLLLLDEPLSNLDASLREELRQELRELQRKIGVTTVYVTHDQTEALELSDLIVVMDKGRIVQTGTPLDIYARPKNAFVASFVGTSNSLKGTYAGSEGNYARVTLEDGTTILCNPGELQATQGAVEISVRPEAATLYIARPAGIHGTNLLDGLLQSVDFLGSAYRYRVKVGRSNFVLYGGEPAILNGPVTVAFPATAASVLRDDTASADSARVAF